MSLWVYLEEAEFSPIGSKIFKFLEFPKLFKIYSTTVGGFETFFIGTKLYYRFLNENNAQHNGILLHNFVFKQWYEIYN